MHKKYLTLFKELVKATEVLSEQVMEYDRQRNDEQAEKTAMTMRQDFADLGDKLADPNYQITLKDYAKLLVAAYIIKGNLETRIKNEQIALNGYENDLMPKLNRIMSEAKTDEEATKLANEIFQVDK